MATAFLWVFGFRFLRGIGASKWGFQEGLPGVFQRVFGLLLGLLLLRGFQGGSEGLPTGFLEK